MVKSQKRRAPLCWYGVKVIFRTTPSGKPKAKDRAYRRDMTLVEERVVLFKARSFKQATRLARQEARSYVRGSHINPYGQRVFTRFLKAYDVCQLYEPPEHGKEVFSMTEVVSRRVPDKTVVDQRMGRDETKREHASRRNVLNREFSGTAKRGV